MIITIDHSNIEETIANNKNLIIDFWAPWCNPCKTLAPLLEDIDSARSDITIAKINIDDYPELGEKYDIRGIPALLKFENAKVVDTFIGAMRLPELNKFIG